jgi:L-asparaginase
LEEPLDGLIVTHGTDTLQYTAAILNYIFGDAPIPIVLVSSNYVLTDARANGFVNFQYAVEFIRGGYGTGVFVSYCNSAGTPVIHCGTRLQPPVPCSDWVDSVGNGWYGKFCSGIFEKNPRFSQDINGIASLRQWKTAPEHGRLRLEEKVSVLRVVPYVGMRYPALAPEVKAVLHESFHSGTIGVTSALYHFMEEAKRRELPVYVSGLSEVETAYETVEQYQQLGLIALPQCAGIAQYCKLWLALSNGLDVSQVMQSSVAQDWICAKPQILYQI